MRFKRTLEMGASVPTGSMGDIVFLLLIFFLATTIFKLEEGLTVTLPRAESGVRVPREKVTHVWVDAHEDISIDDAFVHMDMIEQLLVKKMRENPQLMVGLNMDAALPYSTVDRVLRQLRKANALSVSFTSDLEAS
ncbi:MAG: biopolymer transporter ExbD [Candidatus Eisenbacteria sp.]|nr:biopolymer transporter ExbD [Candidatus Eisenbacteria bacterium]